MVMPEIERSVVTCRRRSAATSGFFRPHVARGPFSVLGILLLAPLAAFLVLGVIPRAFDIEWSCIGRYCVESTGSDTNLDDPDVAGTFGWLLVIIGVLFARIAERLRLAALLPLGWFAALIVLARVVSIGQLPTPD